ARRNEIGSAKEPICHGKWVAGCAETLAHVERPAKQGNRAEVAIQKAVELYAAEIRSSLHIVFPKCMTSSFSNLECIVGSALWKVVHVHAERAVAGNNHLPDWISSRPSTYIALGVITLKKRIARRPAW